MRGTYSFFRAIFRAIFSGVYRWNVIGRENIPDGEGIILCANHISNWDPMLLGGGIERQVHFMAKEEIFKVPVLSALVRDFGAFPVKRGAGDRQAIRKSMELLKEGKVLGIFPEGTRGKPGEMRKVLPGAAMIALKSGARIVPVAIIGPYKVFKPVTIIYGSPVDLSAAIVGKDSSERMQYAAEFIQSEIQKLMQVHKDGIRIR
jgi:1-acyl-sn-glycerol-3-phosphate acyltransferase